MRKIAANMVFPVSAPPIKNGYVVLSDEGEVIDVCGGGETLHEIAGLEYYSGILVPGFVNAHCHLELSHLKGKIPTGFGLQEFIKKIPILREQAPEIIAKEAQKALRYMWSRGINAIGDVMNTNQTLPLKSSSTLKSFNFIEVFNHDGLETSDILNSGNELLQELQQYNLQGNITPHSFYGANFELVKTILNQTTSNSTISIHYKEMASEKRDDLEQRLQLVLHSMEIVRILLVHNCYLTSQNICQLKEQFPEKMNQLYFVLCPNSNLYIDNKLPPLMDMVQHQLPICLGTDSLASNQKLSILDEMITLQQHFPKIAFHDLLLWATLNGAKALGMENELGSFEKGKKPGVLLLTGFDFKNNRLSPSAEVTRLV